MHRSKVAGSLCVALLASACGDDDGMTEPFVDAAPRADAPALVDGGAFPDATIDEDGPAVTVLFPAEPAAGDYSTTAIVTQRRITARCRAAPNAMTGEPVDSASVVLQALGEGVAFTAQAKPASTAFEYTADLVLDGFPNGSLRVRCLATDISAEPRTNSAENATFLDRGPIVNIFAPVENTSHASNLDVLFSVAPAPVAGDDSGGDVDFAGVELLVANVPIALTNQGGGVFSASVPLQDPNLFVPSLDGPQTLKVRAPNSRTPTAVVREASVVFVADSSGPTINVTQPSPGELVSGIVTVIASVTDPAGVDPQSVVGTIAGEHEFEMFEMGGGTFAGAFDTRALGTGMVFPAIVVRAKDVAGNQSSSGFLVALDNVAPVADLNPPAVRESRRNGEDLECSSAFDPLGGDQVKDGMTVAQLSKIRARVDDFGNGASSLSDVIIPVAGVDQQAVQLFILDNSDDALLVDTNGDGVCDEINPLLLPTSIPAASNEALVIDMVPIPSDGSSHFTNAPQPPFGGAEPEASCAAPEEDEGQPEPLCLTTPGTRVIRTPIGNLPLIYGIPPLTQDQCLGNPFDSVAGNIGDGWACLAVRARDNLGNVGVSQAISVCFDADLDQSDGCGGAGSINPSPPTVCTGTFDPSTGQVDLTDPCIPPLSFADLPGANLLRIDL
jgi:hypothetical protein